VFSCNRSNAAKSQQVTGGSSAAIDENNRAPKIASKDQINWPEILPLTSTLKSHQRNNQTNPGTTVGTGLQRIKGHFHLVAMSGALTARLSSFLRNRADKSPPHQT